MKFEEKKYNIKQEIGSFTIKRQIRAGLYQYEKKSPNKHQ